MSDDDKVMLGLVLLLAVLFSVFPVPAFAQADGAIRSEYLANRVLNTASSMNASWATSYAANGSVVGTKAFEMAAPGGRVAANTATYAVSRGVIARAALKAIPLLGAASLAYDLYDAYRIHDPATYQGTPCAAGELCFDFGAETVIENGYEACRDFSGLGFPGGGYKCATAGNPAAAGAALIGLMPSTPTRRIRVAGCDGTSCIAEQSNRQDTSQEWGPWTFLDSVGGMPKQIEGCPASVDPFDPQYSVPAGAAPGADGRCPTARGLHQPITPEQAVQKVEADGTYNWKAVLDEALGRVPVPIAPENSIEVGNAVPRVAGPVTRTTALENGDTRITDRAVGWDFSRDPLRKNEGKWTETVSTMTWDENGNLLNSSESSTEGQTASEAAEQSGNLCKQNPDAAACRELGQAPDEPDLQHESLSLDITPLGIFGPSTAACPAPRTVTVSHGVTLSMPWDLVCTFADGMRPLVIAAAWLGAALLVVRVASGARA